MCCVPGCKTGYKCTKTSHQSSEAIPLFKFPMSPILKKKWINAIPRQDWTVSPNHQACAKYFTESDLIFFFYFLRYLPSIHEKAIYCYLLDEKSALAWELPLPGHLSST